MTRGRPFEIGTVFEVPTKKGVAYVQYTARHPKWGALVWVVGGVFTEKERDIDGLLRAADGYFTFLFIDHMVERGLMRPIGTFQLPAGRPAFPPLFRDSLGRDKDGRSRRHRLWDGTRTWEIGDHLTTEQARIPIRTSPGPGMFLRWLEEGWRPERDEEMRIARLRFQSPGEPSKPSPAGLTVTRHVLYFPTKVGAETAAARLASLGAETTLSEAADDRWVLWSDVPPGWSPVDVADDNFQRLATDYGGEWDGSATEFREAPRAQRVDRAN